MSYNRNVKIYSIEGNIGVGKSTLIEYLKVQYRNNPEILFLTESIDVWENIKDNDGNIIQHFYKDPKHYGFAFQMLAFNTRAETLRRAIRDNPDIKVIICERSLDCNANVFARMLYEDDIIDELQFQIYSQLFESCKNEFKLDGIIYLYLSPDVCFERIQLRERQGEDVISKQYLEKVELYHNHWIDGFYNMLFLKGNCALEDADDVILNFINA